MNERVVQFDGGRRVTGGTEREAHLAFRAKFRGLPGSALAWRQAGPTLAEVHDKKKEHGMDWTQIEGQWHQLTGQVKSRWGKLTDDDITNIGGKKDAGRSRFAIVS